MVITKRFKKVFVQTTAVFCILITVAGPTNIFAQNNTDTSKKVLLAAAHIKKESFYIVKAANVVFPDILKGNELMAADYVANFSNKKRDYLLSMYEKGKDILPKVNTILKKYDVPEEFSVLMMLESACNANAVSKAGAVGYWQIMDAVAKQYGMNYGQRINVVNRRAFARLQTKKTRLRYKQIARQKDDRRNFEKSTIAAAHYLNDRRENLDDNWLFVVASYNCGEGGVGRAIRKSNKANPDFWDIKKFLPAETQAYVMNFIALNVIFKNYDNFVANNLIFTPLKIMVADNISPAGISENEVY